MSYGTTQHKTIFLWDEAADAPGLDGIIGGMRNKNAFGGAEDAREAVRVLGLVLQGDDEVQMLAGAGG